MNPTIHIYAVHETKCQGSCDWNREMSSCFVIAFTAGFHYSFNFLIAFWFSPVGLSKKNLKDFQAVNILIFLAYLFVRIVSDPVHAENVGHVHLQPILFKCRLYLAQLCLTCERIQRQHKGQFGSGILFRKKEATLSFSWMCVLIY